tara:strand:- start:19 stop:198 length:180 start_codon:yes stop_codon:yes gene_type:complete
MLKLIQIIVRTSKVAIVALKALIALFDFTKLFRNTPIETQVKTAKTFEIRKAKNINNIP